jgi:hypothetical protein
MPDVTQHLARALIFAHGDEAVAYAQQAAENLMSLQMLDKVAEWRLVVDAISHKTKLGAELGSRLLLVGNPRNFTRGIGQPYSVRTTITRARQSA